jgi:hypothetical protein
MMKEEKLLKKTEIEIGGGDCQKCHEMRRDRGKANVNEIETTVIITEKTDLDIIDCKMIEVVAVSCLVSLREGKMPRGSVWKLRIPRGDPATAGPPSVRNGFVLR